jgi:hypothetical protein
VSASVVLQLDIFTILSFSTERRVRTESISIGV